jgi:hypothetical protein
MNEEVWGMLREWLLTANGSGRDGGFKVGYQEGKKARRYFLWAFVRASMFHVPCSKPASGRVQVKRDN